MKRSGKKIVKESLANVINISDAEEDWMLKSVSSEEWYQGQPLWETDFTDLVHSWN